MQRLTNLLFVGVALFLVGADPVDPAKTELAALEGTWTMASLEVEGQKIEAQRIEGSTLTIKDGTYAVTTRGQTHEAKLSLDLKQSPLHIDMTPLDGPNKNKAMLGIYKRDGDTFTLCRSINPDFGRPKEFATAPGTGLFLVTWKRQSP